MNILMLDKEFPVISSADDLSDLPWIEINPRQNTNFPGIYALIDRDDCCLEYIGKSNRIGWRLRHGNHAIYQEDKHRVFVIYIEQKGRRDYFECELIRILNPRYNKIRGHMPPDAIDIEHQRYAMNLLLKRIKEAQLQIRMEI